MIVPLDIKKVGYDIQMHVHAPKDDIGVSKYISENKVWEPFETTVFRDLVKGKSFFIDVGANLGYYSLIAAKHFNSKGTVISLEPELNNFSLLENNILLNELSNIKAINSACADKTGQAQIKKSVNNFGDHRIVSENETLSSDHIQTTTVDEIIAKEGKVPDLIKIDTQGSELSIIHGMEGLLKSLTADTTIILEYWPHGICDRGQSPDALLEYLKQFDLKILAMYEETGAISLTDLSDLSRWTKTLLQPDSEQYVNLILGKASNQDIIKIKDKYIASQNQLKANQLHLSVINERLNTELNPIGWSFPEEHGVWNNGRYAEIKIKNIHFDRADEAYLLKLVVYPFLVENRIPFQRVNITINQTFIGEYKLDRGEMSEVEISLTEEITSNNEEALLICFEFLDANSPKALGISNEERQLAMLLNSYGIFGKEEGTS